MILRPPLEVAPPMLHSALLSLFHHLIVAELLLL